MRDKDDSPVRERWEGGYDNFEENGIEKSRESSKHRSKEKSKSSVQKDEKDHRGRDRDRSKTTDGLKERERDLEKDRVFSRDKRKDDRDDIERDKIRDKIREKGTDRDKYKDKEKDKERKDKGKDRERDHEKDSDRGRDNDKGKEKSREKEKDRERGKEREREKERDKYKEREIERENDKDRGRDPIEREKGKDSIREKERETSQDRDKPRERDRGSRKDQNESRQKSKDEAEGDEARYGKDANVNHVSGVKIVSYNTADSDKNIRHEDSAKIKHDESDPLASELEDRILKMKEERMKKKSEGASEVLAWVNKSRKLEEKRNLEKEKALQLSKIFEEQDNINQEESDDEIAGSTNNNLGGVKVLHGLDKVAEGGAVVLTLKDQSILADGDINQEVDMLENVEIGQQKRRDDAYKAAKKKTGIYDDKFSDEPGSEKKILPQYDEPMEDEGVTLDASGHFSANAEKKLEELRKRIQGPSVKSQVEDLTSSGRMSTDYYTQEEMLQFKKPKKKKSLRKKEKLDIDALEAEAISAGLGASDLGSRNDKRQARREEEDRAEAETRSSAFKSAYEKAEEASKALRTEKTRSAQAEDDETEVLGDDDEELRKSLERARKLALKKQDEGAKSVPEAIALLATSAASNSTADNQTSVTGELQENKVVFTEMEEFVWGLQLDEEAEKRDTEDVFMEEDIAPVASDQEMKDEDSGWKEVKENKNDEAPKRVDEEEIVPDETIHEVAVGKGLSGALKLLKDRGTLKEGVEWGGRNMDKKKSKLVGINDEEGPKEIRIERTDEYGRILTPKEAFRLLSHKFHGKGPGKMKQEKRMRQYQEELKVKQMKNADTPSLSVERMREAQAQLKTPYLVLSGHVKPGQTSDPRSGFATVEKDVPGSLTPMLGDRKVENFLGIKRKQPDHGDSLQKKPRK